MADRARPGTNVKSETIRTYSKRVREIEERLRSEHGSYMARCADLRQTMKSVYDDAANSGIPKRVFKAVLTAQALKAKVDGAKAEFTEDDDKQMFDAIADAVGFHTTPLGASAKVVPIK